MRYFQRYKKANTTRSKPCIRHVLNMCYITNQQGAIHINFPE